MSEITIGATAVKGESERAVTTMRTTIVLDEICDWRVASNRKIKPLTRAHFTSSK
jgi:hypothetical protein